MKILFFKTNIDLIADKGKISELLDNEKKIMRWELLNEEEYTVLTVLCSGLTENEIEEMIESIGFKCEFWHG